MKHSFDKNEYIIRLYKGEEVVKTLEQFFEQQSIHSGKISGIGAVCDVNLGFYDQEKKQYNSQLFRDDFEIVNFTGNISLRDGNPFLHAHIAIGDSSFRVFGGHLFSAIVSVTGEFSLTTFSKPIHRVQDEETGLKLLEL